MSDQLKYRKNRGHSTGDGDRYEERTLALVFLRCLRERLQFRLSSNDAAGGGKLDDLVLSWRGEGGPGKSALFVQLKHTSAKRAISESSLLEVVKVYQDCYKEIKDSLDADSNALVLCTNRNLVKQQKDVVLEPNLESVHWMKLLDSGGSLYTLNPGNDAVKHAVGSDDQFIRHFYLFCNQSDCEKLLVKIYEELQLLLGADESCCEAICGNLCSKIRNWMNTQDFYITSSWRSWLDIVDMYIKKEVTTCNSVVTRIKYSNVEALQAYIEGCNPAWIRPPGREATALTATKLHQIIRDEKHIMVTVTRLSELEKKILRCWGPFCPWLVAVSVVGAEMSLEQYKEIRWEAIYYRYLEVARPLHLKIVEMQNKSTTTGFPELKLSQGTRLKPCQEAGRGSSIWQKLKKKLMWSILKQQTTAGGGATLPDAEGWTHLHYAAAAGDEEIVRRLIEAGADVEDRDNVGRTAFHLAAVTGSVDCIKLLLSVGVAVNIKDRAGATALHRAAELGRRQIVRLLLAAGADALAQDGRDDTPLHAAGWAGKAECVGLLVRAVTNLELKDVHCYTALHVAARSGGVRSVKLLLAAGADTGAVSDDLQTPLHLAAKGGHTECARLLLQAEADVAAKDRWGASALHCAARSRDPGCVSCLLQAGADIHAKDEHGETPLHWAARHGRAACIALLLEEGADVHQRNSRGQTPLHCAAITGEAECVRLLLDAGADALAQDAMCETPLQAAAGSKHEACLTMLNCAVADRQPTTN